MQGKDLRSLLFDRYCSITKWSCDICKISNVPHNSTEFKISPLPLIVSCYTKDGRMLSYNGTERRWCEEYERTIRLVLPC